MLVAVMLLIGGVWQLLIVKFGHSGCSPEVMAATGYAPGTGHLLPKVFPWAKQHHANTFFGRTSPLCETHQVIIFVCIVVRDG